MKFKRFLPIGIALGAVLVAGGIFGVHALEKPAHASKIAWSQEAGSGTAFPACGSSDWTSTCANNTGQVTLYWDFSENYDEAQIQLYDRSGTLLLPSGGACGNAYCTGQIVGSVTIGGLEAGTYTYTATSYEQVHAHGDDIVKYVTVPNCTPPVITTPTYNYSLSANVSELSPGNGATVRPGDIIKYRVAFNNTNNGDQTGVVVTASAPTGSDLYFQGGGTDAHGDNGNGGLWWLQNSVPAWSNGYYVDYQVKVSSSAWDGASICTNTSTNGPVAVGSNQVPYFTPNQVCNPVSNVKKPQAPTVYASCRSNGVIADTWWGSVSGATGYEVYMNIGAVNSCPTSWTFGSYSAGNNYCSITVWSPSATFSTTPGNAYGSWVRAINSAGESSPSNVASFTCPMQCVSNQGASCTSPANSCGMTNGGTVQCNGSCSVTAPSDSACPVDCTVQHPEYYGPITVTGKTSGSVWGSGPYTGDSDTGAAAVHAGLISVGQTATIQRSSGGVRSNYLGGTANGVATSPYPGSWCSVTYTVSCVSNQGASCTSPANSCGMTNGGTVQCNGSCSAATPLDSACPATLPDVTSSEGTPTGLTADQPITLHGWIPNYGAGPVPSVTFPNRFDVNNAPDGAGSVIITHVTNVNGPIAAYDPSVATPYVAVDGPIGTLPAGNYSYRLCADNDASWNGAITESNEGNNCNIWINFTVGAGAQHPQAYFDAATCSSVNGWAYDPNSPSASLKVHLYKDGPAGTGTFVGEYMANSARQDLNDYFGITGNHGLSFATPESLKNGSSHSLYLYAISANGDGDNPLFPNSPQTITCSATPAPTATLSADDSSVCPAGSPAGNTSTTLHWNSTNASSCSGSNFSTSGSRSGAKSVSPSANTTYSVVCNGDGGTSNQPSQTVTVKSASDPSCGGVTTPPSISVSPTHIHSGQSTKLTWSAGSCSSVTITGENGFSSTALSGNNVDSGAIYSTSKFTISGSCGSDDVTVTVIPNIIEI